MYPSVCTGHAVKETCAGGGLRLKGRQQEECVQEAEEAELEQAVGRACVAISTNAWMFFAQRPQQPFCLSPNLDFNWQGVTTPARPASRTSDSVIPLHKQIYICQPANDYEKHSQYAIGRVLCQAP